MSMAMDKITKRTLLREACLINGKWVGSPDTPVNNPATGETVARVPAFGAAEAKQAVEAAAAALPAWSAKTAKERAAILHRWFRLMIDNKEDLAVIMTS